MSRPIAKPHGLATHSDAQLTLSNQASSTVAELRLQSLQMRLQAATFNAELDQLKAQTSQAKRRISFVLTFWSILALLMLSVLVTLI